MADRDARGSLSTSIVVLPENDHSISASCLSDNTALSNRLLRQQTKFIRDPKTDKLMYVWHSKRTLDLTVRILNI
jgi:hypothetical protein